LISFDGFVGLPYRDRGRDRDGLDCFGLLRLVYREALGIDLPSYAEDYVTAADRREVAGLISGQLDPWDRIEEGAEIPGDALLMRNGRFAQHVGVVVPRRRVLHIEMSGVTSRIEPYDHGPLAQRKAGFYRYRNSPPA